MIHMLKICNVVLLPALKPACSSAMIFSAFGFSMFSMALLEWLLRVVENREKWRKLVVK